MRNFIEERVFGRRALIAVSLLAIVALLAVGVFNVQVKGPGGDNGGLLSVSAGQRTLVIGAVDSVAAAGTVDYTCDGVADNVQFQAALNALPAGGGRISVLAGTYVFAAGTSVTRAIDNVTISGVGRATYFTGDGVTAIFAVGGANWKFEDLRTDAGGITENATTVFTNVLEGATYWGGRVGAGEVEGSNFDINGGTIDGAAITVSDDVGLRLGTDGDQVAINRSAVLGADTALANVLIGAPISPALAANSLVVANTTANGDVLFAANVGGNSYGFMQFDASQGILVFHTPGIGAAGYDFSVKADAETVIASRVYNNGGVVGKPYSSLAMMRARGTEAVPLAVQSGDVIGAVSWDGWYTGAPVDSAAETARIEAIATENYTDNAHLGAALSFRVTPTGTGGPVQKMYLDNNGSLGVGSLTPNTVDSWTAVTGETILNIYDVSDQAIVAVQGGSGAAVDVVDVGGGADDKWMRYIVDGGIAKFASTTDAGGTNKDNILVMDLGTGHTGIGTVPEPSIGIKYAETQTISDNGVYQGANITSTALKTAAAFTGVASNIIQTYVGAANNQNWTHANYGLIGLAAHTKTEIGSTGTITWAQDFQTFGEYSGATATNHANFYGIAPTGNIGTAYMLYLETPTAGATANYGVYSTGGLNYFGGHVGIGLAPTTDRALNLQDIYTIADDNPRSGAILQAQGSKTSAAFASTVQGVSAQGAVAATNTQNWTAARGLKTLVGQSYVLDGAGGTITGVADVTAAFYTGASTTTNRYGVYIEDGTGAGTLTNQYGLYIEAMAKGGSLNYAIYSGGGLNHFIGNVNTVDVYSVDGTQVVGARVVDARIDDTPNSGDATTDGIIDAIQDLLQAHGLGAAS